MKKLLKGRSVFYFGLCFFIHAFSTLSASITPAFTENKGQFCDQSGAVNSDVLFMYTGKGMKIQLRKTGYSYELFKINDLPDHRKSLHSLQYFNPIVTSHRVDVDFERANTAIEVIKEHKLPGVQNFYVNGVSVPEVCSFRKITYRNIYKNIDAEFIITDNEAAPFKYNLILRAGANVHDMEMVCKGASSVRVDEDGDLRMSTAFGDITETIPFSFYQGSNEDQNVRYSLEGNRISFLVNYNSSKTLIIDPSTNRVWGTYFGGSALDFCTSTGTDASNNVYIGGYSLSTANIATSGAYQSTLSGSFDAYLAKFNSNGVQQWGTYFGGSNFDIFYAIHVMPSGIVYAGGDTGSTSNVASAGAHQTTYGGGIDDAIVVKFDANGQRLWSTYMGGTMHDIAQAITVDGNGDVLLTGHTESTGSISTTGAYGTVYGLNYDVFITKFTSNGVRVWGTYYGDTGVDEAYGITTDASNNVFVTGMTTSLFGISGGNSFQNISGGNIDAFIAKFDPAGANLLWGTYYGGTGDDKGIAMSTDLTTGNVYIGGNTTSTNNIASPSAYQSSIGSADDAFLTAFDPSGNRLWGTYYGGNDVDYITGLILDPNKNIFICGQSSSSNVIGSANAYQNTLASVNFYDAFFAKFSDNGQRKWSTYYGGTDNDQANGIAIDNLNKIYLAGETTSSVSIASAGAHMVNYAGGNKDGFLAKFCVAPEPVVTVAGSATTCVNMNYTLSATNGFSSYVWNTSAISNPLTITGGSVAGTFYYTVVATDADGCDGASDSIAVIVNTCVYVEEYKEGNPEVYPNPASDQLTIMFGSNGERSIEFYDVHGAKMISEITRTEEHYIKLNELPAGIYFLRVIAGGKITDKKIIVQ